MRSSQRVAASLALSTAVLVAGCREGGSGDPGALPSASPQRAAPQAPRGPLSLASATLQAAEVAPNCEPSATPGGSIHARALFDSGMEMVVPVRGKASQAFRCYGQLVTAFYFDMGSEDSARSGASYAAGSLWGEAPGPSARNPDRILRAGSLLAVVSGRAPGVLVDLLRIRRGFDDARPAAAPTAAPTLPTEPDGVHLARMRASLDCASPVARRYCLALDAFATGVRPAIGPRVRVGAEMVRAPDGTQRERVMYLVHRGSRMLWGEITPDNPGEAAQLQAVLATLRGGGALAPNDPVDQYAQTLLSRPLVPVVAIGRSHTAPGTPEAWLRDTPDGTVMLVLDGSPARGLAEVAVVPR